MAVNPYDFAPFPMVFGPHPQWYWSAWRGLESTSAPSRFRIRWIVDFTGRDGRWWTVWAMDSHGTNSPRWAKPAKKQLRKKVQSWDELGTFSWQLAASDIYNGQKMDGCHGVCWHATTYTYPFAMRAACLNTGPRDLNVWQGQNAAATTSLHNQRAWKTDCYLWRIVQFFSSSHEIAIRQVLKVQFLRS